MLIVFFIRVALMIKRETKGQTVNQKYYSEVLNKLREIVRTKRLELWKTKSWILLQDNSPTHNAFAVE
jgi:hypothetical protein